MLYRLLHAKLNQFLDVIPTTDILERFSSDLGEIDSNFKAILDAFFFTIAYSIALLLAIVYSVAWYIIPIIFIYLICVFFLSRYYLKNKRELYRLQCSVKLPILSMLADTIGGLSNIRAMKLQDFLGKKFQHLIEEDIKSWLLLNGALCWFRVRMSGLYLIVSIPCYGFIILEFFFSDASPENVAMLVFASSSAIQAVVQMVEKISDFENFMIKYERCLYLRKIPIEENYKDFDLNLNRLDKIIKNPMLGDYHRENFGNLPKFEGKIEFQNVSTQYSQEFEPVLQNLSFVINPNEKIGVVGSYGSGKSSFVKLFWGGLLPATGSIYIDNEKSSD